MKKIKIYLAALLILGFTACKKDFLDVKPTSAGNASEAIKTVADAKVIVNGMMSKMTSSNYYGRNFILYGDVKGGDLTIYSQGRGLDGLYTFNHSKTTSSYSGFWNQIYNCILQANSILANIDKLKTEGTTENFDNIQGQVLTARAMMYYDLVRIYGKTYTLDKTSFGVPNITQPLEATAQPLRATVEQNYVQIMSDLTTAAPLLSKSKSNGYLNYYGNMALQARVNLTMGEKAKALIAAKDVITGPYSLYSNANWVSSWKTQFGSESIFELGIFPNEGDLGNSSLSIYLRRKNHGSSQATGFFMASDYYLARLGQDATDVRWGVMSYDETSASRLGASYKYSGDVTLSGDGKSTGTAVNIKVIRLSEIYLIAAEAALGVDNIAAAGYLNAIRKRAPLLAPATNLTITLDMILEERSKELFTEGQRYFDMLRLNKSITYNDEFGGITVTARPKTIDRTFPKSILPISQDEINANPGLAAQQNPGY